MPNLTQHEYGPYRTYNNDVAIILCYMVVAMAAEFKWGAAWHCGRKPPGGMGGAQNIKSNSV